VAERVTIFGAGPVGSLLALMLARRGFAVDVYERRPDMRVHPVAGGRSINLAVSARGLYALHQVGLDDEVLAQAVPMLGRMVHGRDGARTFLRYGRDDSEHINSMSRGGLNKLLMTRAEAAGDVRIHFSRRLVGYHFDAGEAALRDEQTGRTERIAAPVAVGTDGSASVLRKAMGARVSESPLDFGYKELTMPPLGTGGFALEPGALHIWPRGSYMLIALPNRDGSFTCTLFLRFEGDPSFARLVEARSVRAFFAREFADALPLVPDLVEQFLAAPLGRMSTVKAWPWSRGSALLVGDAAHAIVPFFGQGMNAGFEDCTELDALFDSRTDWEQLFARFAERRKPDTDAIADLAVENFVEMRDRVADPRFLLEKEVEAELSRRMPGEYVSRYQLVTFTRVPYRAALEAGKIQASILSELCAGKARAGEIDYERAARLVRERLSPSIPSAPPTGRGSS